MREIRMLLTIDKNGDEAYSVQVKKYFIWFTQFTSTNKAKANSVYLKIAKALGY